MNKRIMIMAGGTGGHVFPALAVALNLKKQGWTVTWLGTEKGLEARVVPENEIDIDWLSITGLRGKGLLAKVKSVFLLFCACLQARRYLRQRQPDVVLGMGGFVAAPGGLMARWLEIPLVIHEQNRVVGTTNKLLAKCASQVLQAFPDSFKASQQAVTTGNPLREDFITLAASSNIAKKGCIKVLVVGGSQGAQILNEVVPKAMALLDNIQVKHQTGSIMLVEVTKTYHALDVNAEAVEFIDDIAKAYTWADLVVCRSGAMTVSEVAAMGLPAIFIPLPHAIDDHQTANAAYLTESEAGIMIKQSDLTAEFLAATIQQMSVKLESMSKLAKDKARLQATADVVAICQAEVTT